MINWKVRVRNKNFWLSIIPAVIVLIQAIAAMLGVTLDLTETGAKLVQLVDAVFIVLAILGIVNDPTTEGLRDSERAMGYDTPYKYGK